MANVLSQKILDFWFRDMTPDQWFISSAEMDQKIREIFMDDYQSVIAEEADKVVEMALENANQAMATIILLDQFPRNMYRGRPESFAADQIAVRIAYGALEREYDMEWPERHRVFCYLPLEHSENLADQEKCVTLVRERCNVGDYLKYAEQHLGIIRTYGRFPHRNSILGRDPTPAEQTYLNHGGATFGADTAKP